MMRNEEKKAIKLVLNGWLAYLDEEAKREQQETIERYETNREEWDVMPVEGEETENAIAVDTILNVAAHYPVDQSDMMETFLCELLGVDANTLYGMMETAVSVREEA